MDKKMPIENEIIAVIQLKQGNLGGLEILVRNYQERALAAAYLIVQDAQLAEDIVQTGFIKAFERIGQFDVSRPFGPWFLRSIVNAAIDVSKNLKRNISLDDHVSGDALILAERLPNGDPGLENLVETAQVYENVRNALKYLSPEQRAVVVMRYYLNFSDAEISGLTAKPLSTIKWWLRVAKKRLRALLHPISNMDSLVD